MPYLIASQQRKVSPLPSIAIYLSLYPTLLILSLSPHPTANRKGPAPAAAFPNGLPPLSDEEEASLTRPKSQSAQRGSYYTALHYLSILINVDIFTKGDASRPCACKSKSVCNCATPRTSSSRRKRSGTPPKAKLGDIRATSSHPASEAGDLELPQIRGDSQPRELSHGHSARSTHGAALYNPYGLAHDLHMRGHDLRGHDASSLSPRGSAGGYTYPVLPLAYDSQSQLQQQETEPPVDQQELSSYGLQAEVSPAWAATDKYSDVDNLFSTVYQPEPSSSVFTSYGTVDVDAWLRQMIDSNSVFDGYSSDSSNSGSSFSSQALAVPSSLDLPGNLSREQEFSSAPSQFGGIYNDLSAPSAEFDMNRPFYSSQADGNDNSAEPSSAMNSRAFDQSLLGLTDFRADAADKSDLIHAPTPFSAFPSLTLGYSDESLHRIDAVRTDRTGMIDGDLQRLHQRVSAVPPLSRSSSTGSHASSRSRSSFGVATHGFGSAQSDVWHNTYDHGYSSAETGLWPYQSFHHQVERGRAYSRLGALQQQQAVSTLSQSLPKDVVASGAAITSATQFSIPYH